MRIHSALDISVRMIRKRLFCSDTIFPTDSYRYFLKFALTLIFST